MTTIERNDRTDPDTVSQELLAAWVSEAAAVAGDADRALTLAARLGPAVPPPGRGRTDQRWRALTEISAADLTAGRVAEAHLDALAILAEAGLPASTPELADLGVTDKSTWGVFAAEGPGVRLDAEPDGHRWRLTGTKPWCSLADRLSHALITAHTGDGRRLFAVALRTPHVTAGGGVWVSRGLAEVVSTPIDLDRAPAVPVGAAGWYLERDGFAWGGVGVAACWYGGAVGVARRVRAEAANREPDQIALMHVGGLDVALYRARTALHTAAADIDAGRANGPAGAVLAGRVRAVVADAAEEVCTRAGHALGPAPLTMDADHARRVSDLMVYIRQHHAERDLASIGRAAVDGAAW